MAVLAKTTYAGVALRDTGTDLREAGVKKSMPKKESRHKKSQKLTRKQQKQQDKKLTPKRSQVSYR